MSERSDYFQLLSLQDPWYGHYLGTIATLPCTLCHTNAHRPFSSPPYKLQEPYGYTQH